MTQDAPKALHGHGSAAVLFRNHDIPTRSGVTGWKRLCNDKQLSKCTLSTDLEEEVGGGWRFQSRGTEIVRHCRRPFKLHSGIRSPSGHGEAATKRSSSGSDLLCGSASTAHKLYFVTRV